MSLEDEVKTLFLKACKDNNIDTVERLIRENDINPSLCDENGITALMYAAEAEDEKLAHILLQAGFDWQTRDKDGFTAGEYAMGNSNKDVFKLLLEWGVQSEMVLGRESLKQKQEDGTLGAENEAYLRSKIEYVDEKLMDENGEAVMMGWEAPLMFHHAKEICWKGDEGHVLNIGFGLGIIDTEIQKFKPKSHTIIEAHPDVYQHMCRTGWRDKENVKVVFGRWQDVIDDLGPFDGIFFDTYGEYYEDMQLLHQKLPHLLTPGGIYSFFNGLSPDNIFFHMICGEVARRELNKLNFRVEYQPIPIDATQDAIWEGVQHRYWHFKTYFLPVCKYCPQKVIPHDQVTDVADPA